MANREFGNMICQLSDGSIYVQNPKAGDPIFGPDGTPLNTGSQPTVDVDYESCPAGSLPLGAFHSHPGLGWGATTPSTPDIAGLMKINEIRGGTLGRIYIGARASGEGYKIFVYDISNSDAERTNEPGPEVNPEAEPCPS